MTTVIMLPLPKLFLANNFNDKSVDARVIYGSLLARKKYKFRSLDDGGVSFNI